jgi:molybdenum cofactor synthesis domain-containing protein
MSSEQITAGILIIGNEILSGRIQDLNIHYITKELDLLGIIVKEVRIIPDEEQIIIDAVQHFHRSYEYVFTTGGIGPTHDDITAECVAQAFNAELIQNEAAVEILRKRKTKLHPMSLRMANMPKGATLLGNPVTHAPGFKMQNVYVLAGVPEIMRGMFQTLKGDLKNGSRIYSRSIDCDLVESFVAEGLGDLQNAYDNLEIGSYPFKKNGKYGVNVVLRSRDQNLLSKVVVDVQSMVEELGGKTTVLTS